MTKLGQYSNQQLKIALGLFAPTLEIEEQLVKSLLPLVIDTPENADGLKMTSAASGGYLPTVALLLTRLKDGAKATVGR